MDVLLIPLLTVIGSLLGIYQWIVIVRVVMSWLVSFHVINQTNHFVLMVMEFVYRATEPVLWRIRRFLPTMNGFDLSPFVLILFLWFLEAVIGQLMIKINMVGSV